MNNEQLQSEVAEIAELTDEQRIEVLANLIYDRIIEDRAHGEALLKRIMEVDDVSDTRHED